MPLILQLDSQGQPHKWISWQDAITYHAKDLVSWSLGEQAFIAHGGSNRLTGEKTVITTASIIAIKGTATSAKRRRTAPSLSNRELFRRDRHMCAYCGGQFTDSRLTRDHIMPKSRGGADSWTNVVTCCGKCNQRKDARTPEEANMMLLYVPYVPSRAEHLVLANRSILVDQMEFLLNFIPKDSRLHKEMV